MADENIKTVEDSAENEGSSTSSLNGLALKSRDGYTGKLFLPSTADIATLNTAQADITSIQNSISTIDPTARFIVSRTEPETADDGKILLLTDCPPYVTPPVTMAVSLMEGNPDLPEYYTAEITPRSKSTKQPVEFTISGSMKATFTFGETITAKKFAFTSLIDLFTIAMAGNSSIANSFYTYKSISIRFTLSPMMPLYDANGACSFTDDDYDTTVDCFIPSSMYFTGATTSSGSTISDLSLSTFSLTYTFALTLKPRDTSLCVPCGGVDIKSAHPVYHTSGSPIPTSITMNTYATTTSEAVSTSATMTAVFVAAPTITWSTD